MEKKLLYVVRHAKAEEHSFTKKDFDRDLVETGVTRANDIAHQLKAHIPAMDDKTLVISSTATRAAQTAEIFCQVLGYPLEHIQWQPAIYEAHYLFLMKQINDVSANYDTVFLFGHNPGVSDFVEYISNRFVDLKTAHVACLQLEENIDFSTLSANTATLTAVITEC